MRRSLASTMFEMLVPVILILLGLLFTKVHFDIDSPPRQLVVDLYPGVQKIMTNSESLIKSGKTKILGAPEE
jgi:hypothetical protein